MTIEEIQKEIERVLPICEKYNNYLNALQKELALLNEPAKTLEELKVDADALLMAEEKPLR